MVGDTLAELGYELATSGHYGFNPAYRAWNRFLYRQFFELKLKSKTSRVLRTFRKPLSSKDIDQIVLVEENAATRHQAIMESIAERR